MKRHLVSIVLLCILIVVSCVDIVKADSIMIPTEAYGYNRAENNKFVEDYRDECDYIGAMCTTVDEAKLYTSPKSYYASESTIKGEEMRISFFYEDSDGCQWGLIVNDIYEGWIDITKVSLTGEYIGVDVGDINNVINKNAPSGQDNKERIMLYFYAIIVALIIVTIIITIAIIKKKWKKEREV